MNIVDTSSLEVGRGNVLLKFLTEKLTKYCKKNPEYLAASGIFCLTSIETPAFDYLHLSMFTLLAIRKSPPVQ